MIFKFFKAKPSDVSDVEAFDVERSEVFHPAIADLMIAQEKGISQSSHDRDYGAARKAGRVPAALL